MILLGDTPHSLVVIHSCIKSVVFTITLVLYVIALHSNDEEHTVPLSQLENLNGLPLAKKDATIDTDVIWMHKGKTPYQATIVGIHTDKGNYICTYSYLYIRVITLRGHSVFQSGRLKL